MSGLPTGTVTFLFADAEGSTDLLQRLGDEQYKDLLDRLRQNLREVFASHGGTEVDQRGEEFFVAFPGARDALIAAIDAQRRVALIHPDAPSIRIRIGLHTGEPISTESGYVGIDVHRAARICAAGHGGQILVSQRTSDLLREDLPPEIDLVDVREHRLKDLQQPEQLYQVSAPDLQDSFPPLRTLSVLRNNLPFLLTSFVGRLREMDEIRQLLTRHRLVTLTGIGGCGKTRLALQVAAEHAESFQHGVWLIDLYSITTGDLILPTVVTTLQVREQPGRTLEATLVDFLREKQLLLILDNCEHLLDACAGVAHTLLRHAPKLRILATSREPLRIQGEQRYDVPPLELPDLTAVPSSAQLTASEAVQLFVERAVLGQHRFALTDRNAQAVAQIVARLDGIPLAIELAAAKVKLLSTAQIAERLHDRFGLLAGGSHTALGRQQTLRAMMDWSYELLLESERTLLRRLSVFAGGFTLEAAEAIVPGAEVGRQDVLDFLSRLVDKSLVVADAMRGGRRYRLLDTVREYAKERLMAAGEAGLFHNAHRDWFLALAQQAEPSPDEPNEVWLDRFEADHDNLRAAIEYSMATNDAEVALRLGTALWRFWHVRGHWTEGRQRLEAALSVATRAPPDLRAKALHAAGMLARRQGDYERATALSEESLNLQKTLGDAHGIATSLTTLGNIAYVQANYTSAWELHEESLRYGREAENKHAIAASLHNLALVADHLGDYQRATTLCRESLEVFRQAGDKQGCASALHLLGVLASDQADYAAARAFAEESLAIHRELGDKMGVAAALGNLGLIARENGDYETARAFYEESLSIRRELGEKLGIAAVLSGLGVVAFRQTELARASAYFKESLAMRKTLGDKAGIAESLEGLAMVGADRFRAVMILAAAASLRGAIRVSRSAADQENYTRYLTDLRSALGEEHFAAAWSKGEILTTEQAIEYAMAVEPYSLNDLEGSYP